MEKFISDKYRKNRGGWSRVLLIFCNNCKTNLFYYQKDGPGILKRCYLDRVLSNKPNYEDFYYCPHCNEVLGLNEPYAKEDNRPAIRWLVDAVTYQIVSYTNFSKSNL